MTTTNYTQYTSLFLTDLATRTNSEATINNYTFTLNGFGSWLEQNDKEVSCDTITEWKTYELNKGVSNNSLRLYLTLLQAFFKWCVKKGYIEDCPICESDFPLAEQVRHDIPTIEEAKTLLSGKLPKYTQKDLAERNRAIVTLYLESGARVSELTHIRLCDLNFDKQLIVISKGKGNKERTIPFPPLSQTAVQAYIEFLRLNGADLSPTAYLFRPARTSENKPISADAVTSMVKGYVSRLTGHKGIGSHDLRHAAASLWDNDGVPMRYVQQNLGHSNVQTTERIYVTILDREKAAMRTSEILGNRLAHA